MPVVRHISGNSFFYGATFIFGTIFVQGGYGGTATNAGLILTPMCSGLLSATKTSYRNLMIASGVLLLTRNISLKHSFYRYFEI
jgi:hypothetical protein